MLISKKDGSFLWLNWVFPIHLCVFKQNENVLIIDGNSAFSFWISAKPYGVQQLIQVHILFQNLYLARLLDKKYLQTQYKQ